MKRKLIISLTSVLAAAGVMFCAFPSELQAQTAVHEPAPQSYADINENTSFVIDDADLLDSLDEENIQDLAASVSIEHNIGVYVITIDDYTDYSCDSIEDFSDYYYEAYNLSGGGDTVAMFISMDDRSYDIFAHGDFGNYAFTDYGKEQLADYVIPYLSEGDYYHGFYTFVSEAESMIEDAENDDPVDIWIPDDPEYEGDYSDTDYTYDNSFGGRLRDVFEYNDPIMLGLILVLIPAVIAFIVRKCLKGQLISVHIAKYADHYIGENGIQITNRYDRFIRTETHRERIVHDDEGPRGGGGGGGHFGGTTINSGGSSHSSGHF